MADASRTPVRDLEPEGLPAVARWVLRAERTIRNSELPPALRRGDDPGTPSPFFLLTVMAVVGGGFVIVLFETSSRSGLRMGAGPVVAALWAGALLAIEPGRLSRPRFGPWLPAAMWWFGALVALETVLEAWTRPRPVATALQTLLAAGAGLVAWGKARLDHEA